MHILDTYIVEHGEDVVRLALRLLTHTTTGIDSAELDAEMRKEVESLATEQGCSAELVLVALVSFLESPAAHVLDMLLTAGCADDSSFS
ncbi:MAG: hypothetical protein GW917_01730 [Bdellovibrionales bacterium]|nr:hypothetical protein [Bdellovibrionales bacterium]